MAAIKFLGLFAPKKLSFIPYFNRLPKLDRLHYGQLVQSKPGYRHNLEQHASKNNFLTECKVLPKKSH